MSVVIAKGFTIALATVLVFSGGLLLWQLAVGVGVHGTCYNLPLGLETIFPPPLYQSGCFPVYYAGDLGLALLVLGFLSLFVNIKLPKGRPR